MKSFNCTVSDKRGYNGLCMEEAENGMFVLREKVEKHQERIKKGTTKLLKCLNEGKSVYVGEGTVAWLKSCGFEVEILPLPPYQGNLPVEDRIPTLYIKLEGK
ncbi:conserved hypothetical protein [Vibrio phage 249E41-1]|nr:conserved hypothetical protein [Vibrio phage 249E41-1]